MGLVTLVLVLAAVSGVVCLVIDEEGDQGSSLRERAARIGRTTEVQAVRLGRVLLAGLLRADDLLRTHRRIDDLRFRPPRGAVAVESSPSRFLALVELVILALLTGAAVAAALVGLAWVAVRSMT